ncbi:MAG: hypothetical protein K0Q73_4518 [Paenibacillus sp.]|jgi:hypothetical protein|nr:hypothetical protein [Paenibacillus sp.]
MAAAMAASPDDMTEDGTITVRLVLRITDRNATNPYVDGTDVYVCVDEKSEKIEFTREDLWIDGPLIFHGGTVSTALARARELNEQFYLQFKDPFLISGIFSDTVCSQFRNKSIMTEKKRT